tara:strand:- start:9170 stop:9424 length:255 start_codon:yes stop_codon:yes gene_type:complete
MATMFEKLKEYFLSHSEEEVNDLWKATSKFDSINSPTVEEFLRFSGSTFKIKNPPPENNQQNFVNIIESPKFTSDFLFTKYSLI